MPFHNFKSSLLSRIIISENKCVNTIHIVWFAQHSEVKYEEVKL
jgi:hypothetical protein